MSVGKFCNSPQNSDSRHAYTYTQPDHPSMIRWTGKKHNATYRTAASHKIQKKDGWTEKCQNNYLTLDLSSSRIQKDALSYTLTPFCSVCRQFFGFIPGDVHVLQISSDNVHPVFPWPSQLPLVAPQFPLYSLTRHSRVIHS